LLVRGCGLGMRRSWRLVLAGDVKSCAAWGTRDT